MSTKSNSGGSLPAFTLPCVGGGEITLGKTNSPGAWQIVIVYRGVHCPICNKYLKRLEELREGFAEFNTELIAVSSDPIIKAQKMVENHGLKFPVSYDLNVEQMRELDLYISDPRSPEETDRSFAEPATFALNAKGRL